MCLQHVLRIVLYFRTQYFKVTFIRRIAPMLFKIIVKIRRILIRSSNVAITNFNVSIIINGNFATLKMTAKVVQVSIIIIVIVIVIMAESFQCRIFACMAYYSKASWRRSQLRWWQNRTTIFIAATVFEVGSLAIVFDAHHSYSNSACYRHHYKIQWRGYHHHHITLYVLSFLLSTYISVCVVWCSICFDLLLSRWYCSTAYRSCNIHPSYRL